MQIWRSERSNNYCLISVRPSILAIQVHRLSASAAYRPVFTVFLIENIFPSVRQEVFQRKHSIQTTAVHFVDHILG